MVDDVEKTYRVDGATPWVEWGSGVKTALDTYINTGIYPDTITYEDPYADWPRMGEYSAHSE
jgi:hypothetical protein